MKNIMETIRNLFLWSREKVAPTGTAGTGERTARFSGRWLSPARPAGVFVKLLTLFMAVGFSGQTLAQEAVQTPVSMIDTTQFITILSCFGAIIVIGGTMFWVLVRRIDSVEELIVKNETQNQKEHASLEKQNQKEHAALEMKIKEVVRQSEANVIEKIHQFGNTLHKLIGQLEGARLIPNTGTASQTESNEGVQTATA